MDKKTSAGLVRPPSRGITNLYQLLPSSIPGLHTIARIQQCSVHGLTSHSQRFKQRSGLEPIGGDIEELLRLSVVRPVRHLLPSHKIQEPHLESHGEVRQFNRGVGLVDVEVVCNPDRHCQD